MQETMGQIIRRLRKERNMTQEELAEQLGVTFQAVSKWENNSGMPDISQVIPIATVFNVSTDVLFGIYGTNNAEEVDKIIKQARSKITYPATKESFRQCYDELQKGLEKYPNNTVLLSQCLELGISLSYPENDTFDFENGESIYNECIREADIVIKYSKNTTDVLRAHMIMALLHAAYGNFEMAKNHANEFPWRADMTFHKMKSYIAHFEKDFRSEDKCCQNDFMYHFEAIIDDIVEMGYCHYNVKDYANAEYAFTMALAIIHLICKDEDVIPHFHYRERGDIYSLLAEVCLKQNRVDDALIALEKMVNYDVDELAKFQSGKRMNTPLLHDVEHDFYRLYGDCKKNLLLKLKNPAFDVLKEDDRFIRLMKKVTDL